MTGFHARQTAARIARRKAPEVTPAVTRRYKAPVGECETCDKNGDAISNTPFHDASARCESGKHNHCTCELCY